MFSDVLFIFSDVVRMFSIAHRYSMNILRCAQDVDVFRCSKMLSDVLAGGSGGFGWSEVPSWAKSGYFFAI